MRRTSQRASQRASFRIPWKAIIALCLVSILLWRLDINALARALRTADWRLLVVAALLNIPVVGFKSWRWQTLMAPQGITYPFGKAYLAYFGSIFVGFVTPGRLGEFVKALHVSNDCDVSPGRAFSSVFVDRLFDLYMVAIVGMIALASATATIPFLADGWLTVVILGSGLALPLVILLHDTVFGWVEAVMYRTPLAKLWRKAVDGWLGDLRGGLQAIPARTLLMGVGLTVVAYVVFFWQCYLVAQSVDLAVGFVQTSYAVSLGSLITLMPISISGIGTRDAVLIAYLGGLGVSPEVAWGFSLLLFAAFYIACGLMGAVAWWIKPVPLGAQPSAAETNG